MCFIYDSRLLFFYDTTEKGRKKSTNHGGEQTSKSLLHAQKLLPMPIAEMFVKSQKENLAAVMLLCSVRGTER